MTTRNGIGLEARQEMDEVSRRNFLKLATFLEEHGLSINNNNGFRMESYVAPMIEGHWLTLDSAPEGSCGTSGCAVGWATVAVEPIELSNFDHGDNTYDWEGYCEKVFGIGEFSDDWEFLFGPNNPDDALRAAERIREYLELPTCEPFDH